MDFQKQKNQILSRQDKSKKGSIDKPIKPLINQINKLDNFYTTSSCSGRIILIERHSTKLNTKWHFVSHSTVTQKQIEQALASVPIIPHMVWFYLEPPIFHVCARTVEDATNFLKHTQAAGFKKAGIVSITQKKIMIEVVGTNRCEAPVLKEGKQVISKEILSLLIKDANEKLKKSHLQLNKLKEKLRK